MNFTPLQLAYQALKRQRRRSILTMLAITIGISAVITIMAAGKGVRAYVLGQLEVFGADTLSIEVRVPSAKNKKSADFGSFGVLITTLKDKDIADVQKHPNILAAYGMVSGQEPVSYQGQLKKILLWGEGYSMPEVERFNLAEGRFFSKEEDDSLAAVAVLGSKAKEKLFGDENPLGKIISIRGKPYRVIGVAEPRGSAFFIDMDNVIMLPTQTMQKRLLGINYVTMIVAKMKDGNQSKQTAEDLSYTIRLNHNISNPERDDFVVNTTAEAQEILSTITGGITLLLIAIVCISIIVGGVGIMNIMYVSVAERTFEIGLRKSLGAKRKDILWQFLAEAVLVTVGGGVAGVVLGALLALVIYFIATSLGLKWVYSISLFSILLAVGFSVCIGVLFGIYPARKAATLNPIDALRKE